MIENVFTFRGVNGPMACSSAKALVLAHVTRVKKGIVAPLKFPISVFLWADVIQLITANSPLQIFKLFHFGGYVNEEI